MKKILLIIFVLTSTYSFSQDWRWIDYLQGGGANHTFYDLEISNDEQHVYGVGRYRATATFYGQDANIVSPLYSGSRDVFIAKIDTMGNYEWVITDGGPSSDFAEGIATDEFDNIYVVGTTRDSAYFDDFGILSDATGDVFIAKYNSDGDFIWVKHWGGDDWDFAMEIECDKNGNLYMAGYQTGNYDYGTGILSDAGYFITKLDYDGNVIWCEGPQNNTIWSYTVINSLELYNNELYFGGRVKSEVVFDTITVIAPSWDDMFFAKMDTSGYTQWVRTGGGVYYAACQDIVVKDSFIYVAGSYSGDATFDTVNVSSVSAGTGGQNAKDSRDAFLAKYNSDGSSCYWVRDEKGLNIDENYNVIIDKEDNILVTGGYNEFDLYSQTASEGDLKIIAYDSLGNFVWELFPQGPRKAEGIIMKQDSQGNYYFGGRIKGDYVFDPNITIIVPGGKFTGVISKLYPRLNPSNDSIEACTNDSVWVSIPNQYGSPLIYEWYENDNLITGLNNDSIYTSINNLDSIFCIIHNGYQVDTAFYYITEFNPTLFDLGPDTTTCDYNTSINLQAPSGFQNYDWSTLETSNNITVTQSGSYWLNVTNEFNCFSSDTIEVSFIDCTNLPSFENPTTIIYYQNNFIELTSVDDSYSTLLYDSSGKLILSSKNNPIVKVDELPKGVYILDYKSNDKHLSYKIIVN